MRASTEHRIPCYPGSRNCRFSGKGTFTPSGYYPKALPQGQEFESRGTPKDVASRYSPQSTEDGSATPGHRAFPSPNAVD